MHTFYSLSPTQQLNFQLRLALVFILFNLGVGTVLFLINLPLLIPLIFTVSLLILAPFIDVPSGVKSGNFIYYSPLLMGEKIKKNRLVLHSGSLFDYYFVLDRKSNSQERKKNVFSANIEGLLKLINQYENNQPTHIKIKATSYIINPRTAKKLGLQKTDSDMLQYFILYLNFFNLTCALSLLNNKLTWPKISKTFTYEGDLDSLIAKKSNLIALQNRLNKT
jgi:hypothetical protein